MGCKQSKEESVKPSQPNDTAAAPAAAPAAAAAAGAPPAAAPKQSTERHDARGSSRARPADVADDDLAAAVQPGVTAGVAQPPRSSESGRPRDSRFKGPGPEPSPAAGDELFPCFKEGLLWRIVSHGGSRWSFYNDTQEYEMHITFKFGPDSKLTALGATKMTRDAADGWFSATLVVFPLETGEFVEGKYNGYKSSMSAKPLSAEYRAKVNAAAHEVVRAEMDAIAKLSRGSRDEERVLQLCLEQGLRYVDVNFPPVAPSLSRSGIDSRSIAETAWKRPTQFLPPARHGEIALFRDGIHPDDIDQGQLGDCWLLCAIAALAEYPSKIVDIFRHPASAEAGRRERAIGAYRVTVNKHGWWHVMITDDYLPVVGSKPCFAKCCEDAAEMWVALLEKAYAKSAGSYAAITGGDALQALTDLTGYPTQRFDSEWEEATKTGAASDATKRLFGDLAHWDKEKYLVTLNTPGTDTAAYNAGAAGRNSKEVEERYKNAGLALGHAYTVLSVADIPSKGLRLCKIRNPWGGAIEWSGAWSDHSPLWAANPDVAKACKFTGAADDGTFWMEFSDVLSFFDGGGVCFTKFDWFDYRVRGAFENGYPNLAFEISVTTKVTAYVILSQRDKRGLPSSDPESKYAAMMLSVARADASKAAGRYEVHLNSTANADSPSEQFTFNYARDLAMRYEFTPEHGSYLVIPRIYDAGASRNYVLGIITDTPVGAALRVSFRTLDRKCKVFQNYPRFSCENATELRTAFQFNPEVGCPVTREGSSIAV